VSSPRYSATQLLASATLTYRNASDTTETLDDQFLASNVGDSKAGTVAKFPRNELGAIVAQWSSSKTYNCVAWLNHNLESDVVLKVQKSSDGSAWTDVQTGISLTSTRYWVTFTSQTSTWFRMVLTALGSQTEIPYFGEIWVGTLTTLSRNHAFGVRTGRAFNNVGGRSAWGIPFKYHKNAYDRVTGVMGNGLTSSERDELEALVEAIKGSQQPFLFVPDGATATECWVAEYAADEWETETIGSSVYGGFRLDVQEIPWGKPVS
jgi:hypothetical protein